MATNVSRSAFHAASPSETSHREHDWARFIPLVGRVLFSGIFLMTIPAHFSQGYIGYATQQGVPAAGLLVPLSGIIAFAGGLSVALGYKAKIGAWLLVLFLIPVTFMMHAFWAVPDPQMAQMQQVMFMKNVSILGGALLIAYFGPGPLSLDARSKV